MRSLLMISFVLSTVFCAPAQAVPAEAVPARAEEHLFETSIGMRKRLEELPIPGSKLRPKPVADPQKADVILRVLNVFPHGEGFRYNIEVTPFVSGTLSLSDYLEREDGSELGKLPPMTFTVKAFLPLAQLEPNALKTEETQFVGGYIVTGLALGILWIIGLLAILFVGKKKKQEDTGGEAARPKTLADRLKPLVEKAQKGELDNAEQAALERLLVAHWRQRRGLAETKLGEAIAVLRHDEEAGPLFLRLEQWFHAPKPAAIDGNEITTLLEPYRNAPDLSAAEEAALKDSAHSSTEARA